MSSKESGGSVRLKHITDALVSLGYFSVPSVLKICNVIKPNRTKSMTMSENFLRTLLVLSGCMRVSHSEVPASHRILENSLTALSSSKGCHQKLICGILQSGDHHLTNSTFMKGISSLAEQQDDILIALRTGWFLY